MSLMRLPFAALLSAGLLAAPLSGVRAQEASDGWSLRPLAMAGYLIPLRNMGKNAGVLGTEGQLQVVAEMNGAPMFGGGVEVDVPGRRIRIRATARRSSGMTVDGILSICQTDIIEVRDFCVVQEADATVTEGSVDLLLLSRSVADGLLSPVVFLGAGLRHIEFDNDTAQACAQVEEGDARAICVGIRQIWEASSTDPSFSFGAALRANLQPVEAYLQLRALAGQFGGGTGGSDGETLVDVLLSGGLSIRVW